MCEYYYDNHIFALKGGEETDTNKKPYNILCLCLDCDYMPFLDKHKYKKQR
jgi:hypothetical protein